MTSPNPLGGVQLATATAAKSGSTVTANIAGTVTVVQVARDLTVAAGDVLIVNKVGAGTRSQWFAIGRAFTAAPADVDPAGNLPLQPVYPTAYGTLVVAPTYTGTYRDGAWLTAGGDVQQGVYGGAGNATGAAYYGVKPQALAGATVLGARVSVTRLTGGDPTAQTATLQRITEATFDGGAPTLAASTTGPAMAAGDTVDFAIPTAWGQAIVDGTAGGLGVFDADGVPYMRFAGRAAAAPAWLLSIDWTR